MRSVFATLILAASVSVAGPGHATAIPFSAKAMNETAMAVSGVQDAHYSKRRHRHGLFDYYERHTRHGITKCYRELVVGPYVCRTYRYWFR
jgi:hypothetical protein